MSAATAACLVGGTAWWLVTLSPDTALSEHPQDAAMQVVWLERAPRPVPRDDTTPAAVPAPDAQRVAVTASARARQRGPAGADVERDDLPEASAPEPAPRLDLSLPTAPLAFGTPAGRPIRRRDDIAPVIQVDIRDRSLGATLQGMTRNTICSELRRAAAASLASHAPIEASMAQHGCDRVR
ncbi:hypothetical protein [Luteimonas deserti]|uniref:Uncharacterized protein n=1 Tax=Luteimonas deserti TaxID=2752306 RepID=A0A7Z0QRC9_9GAMM|nr:hypothetical protein [Luteimonas deserti]NYZ62581.1 hypothetical protein [Luteimonas deserti]